MLISSSSGIVSKIYVMRWYFYYRNKYSTHSLSNFEGFGMFCVFHHFTNIQFDRNHLHFKWKPIFIKVLTFRVNRINSLCRKQLTKQTSLLRTVPKSKISYKPGNFTNPTPKNVVTGMSPYVLLITIAMEKRSEIVLSEWSNLKNEYTQFWKLQDKEQLLGQSSRGANSNGCYSGWIPEFVL